MIDKVRRVAIYARVSSDTQKENETVRSQLDQLRETLGRDASVVIVGPYVDEAESGPKPLDERPQGSRLMVDAAKGLFDEVWFFKLDRLGRDDIDPHIVRRRLDKLGIKLHSLHENIESPLEFGLRVLFAAEERRTFLIRTASGMDRAARDGRYCGGIVPVGYRVEGVKPRARLVPDDTLIWGDWSGSDLVRHIYRRLAVDGWPCARVARELNDLRVPTAYRRDGRGVRGKQTQGLWYAGRIRNLIVQPVYKGVLTYGRRSSSRNREVITAEVPALVSEDVWDAAQHTLAANRIIPKNTRRLYLMRGLISCVVCGKRYIGTGGPRYYRYVCNGRHTDRRPPGEKGCFNVNVRGPWFDEIVWADIERALRNPGDVIDDLVAEQSLSSAAAIAEAERTTLNAALENLAMRRQRALSLHSRGAINRRRVRHPRRGNRRRTGRHRESSARNRGVGASRRDAGRCRRASP